MADPIESDEQIDEVRNALQSTGGNVAEGDEIEEGEDIPITQDEGGRTQDQIESETPPWESFAQVKPQPPTAPKKLEDNGPWNEFKQPEPKLDGVKKYFDDRFKDFRPPMKLPEVSASMDNVPGFPPPGPRMEKPEGENKNPPIISFKDAFERGLGMGVTSLQTEGLPKKEVPENAEWYYKAAAGLGQMYGDSPYMLLGAEMGGGASAVAGPFAPAIAPLAAAGGAFALPAALRRALIDNYRNGSVKSFDDFWPRVANVMHDSLNAASIGVATEGAGSLFNNFAPSLFNTAAKQATQLATITSMGAAYEGKIPSASDFAANAALLLPFAAIHLTTDGVVTPDTHEYQQELQRKLEEIHVQTGLHPAQVYAHAELEPTIAQDLASTDITVPKAYEKIADPEFKEPKGIPASKEQDKPFGMFNPEGYPDKDYPSEIAPKSKEDDIPNLLKHVAEREEAGGKGFSWDEAKRLIFDRINPIKKYSPEAYDSINAAWNYGGKVADSITGNGVPDFEDLSKTNSDSLQKIIFPHKGDLDGFTNFLIAAHVKELEEQGITTGVNPEEANKVFEAGKSKYNDAAIKFGKWNNAILDYAQKSGIAGEAGTIASKEQYNYYFPLNRITEEGTGIPFSQTRKVLKNIKGVEEGTVAKFEDPILSSSKRADIAIKEAEINRAKTRLVESNAALGENGFMTKQAGKIPSLELSYEELKKLKDGGDINIDGESAKYVYPKTQLKEGQLGVMVDGKLEVYNPVPGKEGVLEAMKYADINYMDPGVRKYIAPLVAPLKFAAKINRDLVLANPLFPVVHFERQQAAGAILSEYGTKPVWDSLSNVGELMGKNSDMFSEYLRSGGANSAITDMKTLLNKDIYDLSKETGLLDRTRNIIKKPFDVQRAMLHIADQSIRFSEFKNAREAGASIEEAGKAARNISPSSNTAGAAMQIINQMIPFQSLEINSLQKMAEAFKKDPTGMAARAALWITLPSLAAWWLGKDDPLIQKQPQIDRDMNVMLNINGTIVKFPQAWQPGVMFGALPVRVVDGLYRKNPDAFKDFGATLERLNPVGIGPVAKSLVEGITNKDLYRGTPVVPERLEGLYSRFQASEFSSDTSKLMSQMLTHTVPLISKTSHLISPIMIDHQISLWAGSFGQQFIRLADTALEKAGIAPSKVTPEWRLADVPFFRSFFEQTHSTNTQPIQDFYKNAEANSAFLNSLRNENKAHSRADVNDIVQNTPAHEKINLQVAKQGLNNMMTAYKHIYENPEIPPSDKRRTLDDLSDRMTAYAEHYNQMINSAKEKEGKK